MGGRPLEGPTMVGRTLDWNDELGRWLKPFVDRLGHRARRRMCPLYVSGLIGPGDRKSVQPMAKRLVLGEYDQLHHFIAAGVWEASPVETELLVQADRLVGGSDAVLVIDDTALPKKGTHSVGVAPQYAGVLGSEPTARRSSRSPWLGGVLADAEYGKAAEFRQGLSGRGRLWAVGVPPTQKVYPVDVTLVPPQRSATGRPKRHPTPSAERVAAAELTRSAPGVVIGRQPAEPRVRVAGR